MSDPTYKLTSDAILESFEDGALILYLKDVSLIELNESARDILSYTDGSHSIHQVAQQLADMYHIDQQNAMQDIAELYQQLAEQGILEVIRNDIKKEI